MENQLLIYDKTEAFAYAKEFFIRACGFDLAKEKHQRMLTEALEILEEEKSSFQMKAVCRQLDDECYSDGKVFLGIKDDGSAINNGGAAENILNDEMSISCNGFSRIAKEHVKAVYMCMITAGDWHVKGSTRKQVYMDTWGTAFVDGAKILLETKINESSEEKPEAGYYLSDPFGPGYYGMPAADTKKFAALLDASKMGVEVRESGIMVPLKSMAAIYLVTDSRSILPPLSCSECFGKIEGCRSCANFMMPRK